MGWNLVWLALLSYYLLWLPLVISQYLPNIYLFFVFCFFEIEGRHANAKAEEAIDHLASFCQVERYLPNIEFSSEYADKKPTLIFHIGN